MPLTSCQSIMTLAAQKVQKLITNPFIMRVMAINIAPIRSIRLQLCLLLYFPLSALGAPGPILQPDLKPTKHAR
jgi:hypothetical protein